MEGAQMSIAADNAHCSCSIWRCCDDGSQLQVADELATENAVALIYNGISHTVMMSSDQDLIDLAYGFSLTEGIINHPREIYGVEQVRGCNGIELHIELAGRCFEQLKRARRSMAGRTGCGICGTEQLEHVVRSLPCLPMTTRIGSDVVDRAARELNEHQKLNHLTGATHAAALIDQQGRLLTIREDVGRHIALDKLIGQIVRHQLQGTAVIVTSRASFEMVQKVASAGIEILLAVSAATEMAVSNANRYNLTLAGFVRPGRANIYTQPGRIIATKNELE